MTDAFQSLQLDNLPAHETDAYEYKCSATDTNAIKNKLPKAASAFWNSGGGTFVIGVDDHGQADGGIEATVGNQDIRDWLDQVIHQVSPAADYGVRLFQSGDAPTANIDPTKAVVAIHFCESHRIPHMAPDNRYYIRAGAHTVIANGFIVEALFAHRHAEQPRLVHTLRLRPNDDAVVQFGIVALTPTPALDVTLEFDPTPRFIGESEKTFPMHFPVVSRESPFFMDLTTWDLEGGHEDDNAAVRIKYKDLAAREYTYESRIDVDRAIGPLQINGGTQRKIAE